jgi:hypothetical protein
MKATFHDHPAKHRLRQLTPCPRTVWQIETAVTVEKQNQLQLISNCNLRV